MKKIISAIVLLSALSIFTTASFAVTGMQIFADVSADETYKTGIEFLYSEGIVNGYPDGTYQPQRTLNRAEMIKIIAEGVATLEDWPSNTFTTYASQNCFDDVAANQWYTKYVCYAKEHNWVVGYDGGKNFKPDQTVTFVEGLKIAYKGFGLTYTEDSSPWYRDVVEAASRENYIPFDIIAFSNGFKRNQMADLATRIIKGEASSEILSEYLGDRENKVVTYETIEAGINVSEMEEEIEEPGEEDEEGNIDITNPEIEPNSLSVNLSAQNDSGQSGTATFLEFWNEETDEYNLNVTFSLTGSPMDTAQPAHVHTGSCEEIGGVKWALSPVENGLSGTDLAITMQDLLLELESGPLAINIHKSTAESGVYYACGNILAANLDGGNDVMADASQTYTINMTDSGFSPSTLTVAAGDTVRFVNTGSTLKWPASNNHPTHTVYPGSNVSKCGGDETIFDACHGLATDEIFEFIFNETGTWGYHDHIGTANGSITVTAE